MRYCKAYPTSAFGTLPAESIAGEDPFPAALYVWDDYRVSRQAVPGAESFLPVEVTEEWIGFCREVLGFQPRGGAADGKASAE